MNENIPRRPGGKMASRPLHFIWLADGSGSMRIDGKIQALNHAIREAIPHMRTAARENPHASVFVNAIRFADDARWIGEKLTPVSEFRWNDIEAAGETAMGEALTMVGEALQAPLMTDRALAPVIALVTDGLPTDDFRAGLNHLLLKPWGQQSIRVVVAIGEDSASNEAQENFRAFIGDDERHPYQANNPEALVEAIRWVSTAVLRSVSEPVRPDSGSKLTVADPGSETDTPAANPGTPATGGEADVW
ncbi:MAG: hypothetical protein LV479_07180 [Methylacidiphilales bacterium]|nr:hypothetical protein [Candidatus Methylacidiphilales bacterium]